MTSGSRASVPVRCAAAASTVSFVNCERNRAAVARMTGAQRLTGKTGEQLRDEMQAQRARVLQRYGFEDAA